MNMSLLSDMQDAYSARPYMQAWCAYRPGIIDAISLYVFASLALQLRSRVPSTTKSDVHRRACTVELMTLRALGMQASTPDFGLPCCYGLTCAAGCRAKPEILDTTK